MLAPRKTKFRKSMKCITKGKETRGTTIEFGKYALKATTAKWIDARQIEAARRAMTRHVKRGGKIWIRIFPQQPISKKPNEVGMGKGKGAPEKFVFQVRPGRVLFEIDGVAEDLAKEALRLAAHKLPVKTKIIERVSHREAKDED